MTIKGEIYSIIYSILPIKKKYAMEYYRVFGKKINLNNPETLTEKLYWLNRYNEIYNKKLIRDIYDKYYVREYIKAKGYEDNLVPLVHRYNNAEEIDFTQLPNKFILKVTQGSHMSVFCLDKAVFDYDNTRKQLKEWLNKSRKNCKTFGGYYFDDRVSIVCEELLEDENGQIPNDIKLLCFNGEPKYVYVDIDTVDVHGKKDKFFRNIYDLDWNLIELQFDDVYPMNKDIICEKPKNFEYMIDMARALSQDFLFVRVDLYNINGRIYFGELTPIPGGFRQIKPIEYDKYLGDLLKLPNISIF